MNNNNEEQRLIQSENDSSARRAQFAALADMLNGATAYVRHPGGYAATSGEGRINSNPPLILSGAVDDRPMSLLSSFYHNPSSFSHGKNNNEETRATGPTSSVNPANDPNGNPPKYRDYFLPMEPKQAPRSGISNDSGKGTTTEESDLEERKYTTLRKWTLKDGKPIQIYEEQIPSKKKSGPLNTGIPPKFRALGWPSWKKDVPYPIGQLPLLVHTCENKPVHLRKEEYSMED